MQLSFACRIVTVDQLLKCSLGLSRTEMRFLKQMPGKETDVQKIAKMLGKDRTVVQKALTGLQAKGLVIRRQINLASGGYYFVYKPVPKQIIKERIYANFKSFNKAVEDAIERW